MKILNFIASKWKVTTILLCIAIATVVGVAVVKASTVTIMVDKSTIAFTGTNMTETISATANLSLDPGVSSGSFQWTVDDPQVATVTANEGNGSIISKGAGKTTVNISYSLSDGTTDTKKVPIVVPRSVNYDNVKGVMRAGASDIVSCDAATSKYVQWTSSNSNIVSVVADTSAAANGSIATITAVSGGTATITCSIPSDSLAALSFTVTVGGQRTGSAPGAGRSRAARVGNRVVAGMGGGPSCAPGIPTAAGKAPGAWQGRGGAGRGALLAGVGEGFPVVLSGVVVAAWNAHCVRSCVPKGRHPVGAAEGCGPQVRELGLRGAGNHVVRPLLAQPGGRRKASPLGSRP